METGNFKSDSVFLYTDTFLFNLTEMRKKFVYIFSVAPSVM